MVARSGLSEAVDVIDSALQELPNARGRVRVVITDLDHIHAFVGSDRFMNLGPVERQQDVWDYLSGKVDGRHLSHLYRVFPMDTEEFTEFIRDVQIRTTAGQLSFFTHGESKEGDPDG